MSIYKIKYNILYQQQTNSYNTNTRDPTINCIINFYTNFQNILDKYKIFELLKIFFCDVIHACKCEHVIGTIYSS